MAGVLNIIYAVVVALVAIVGYSYVLTRPDDGTTEATRWSDWGTIAAVTLFVVALVWSTFL
jgi:ABC-type Co2+ transport system permease subunit